MLLYALKNIHNDEYFWPLSDISGSPMPFTSRQAGAGSEVFMEHAEIVEGIIELIKSNKINDYEILVRNSGCLDANMLLGRLPLSEHIKKVAKEIAQDPFIIWALNN